MRGSNAAKRSPRAVQDAAHGGEMVGDQAGPDAFHRPHSVLRDLAQAVSHRMWGISRRSRSFISTRTSCPVSASC